MTDYTEESSRSPRILLVEDHPMLQEIHVQMLTELNCIVDVAACGIDAVEKAMTKYDLIFMDLDLPDINGIRVASVFKYLDSPNHDTPIVALTANKETDIKERCFAAGMADFAAKPIKANGLHNLLSKHIKHYG